MTKPVTCLIVDDLEDNLVALSALLRRDDVEVLVARSGAEALELLLAHDVALALLDVQMPEMSGFELAELMRGSERTRHVPIIFVTAGTRDQHRLFKGYESGAVDFLYKPVDPYIVRNKAEVFFELYRQRRQLAADLEERTRTLRLNEMFTAVLGHDLRNPLNAILTSAQVLQHCSTERVVLQSAERITSSGRRMTRMIEDLLDLARARLGGGIPLRRATTDLGAIVLRVAQEHRVASPGSRIEIAEQGHLSGHWDGDRLAQVVSNLIANAVQHGDRDQPIAVEANGLDAGTVVVTVSNGGTIPRDVLPNLFEPFRRSGPSAGQSDGLGLGLYIVQQIVTAHGGVIAVDATQPGRTTFRLTLAREPVEVVRL